MSWAGNPTSNQQLAGWWRRAGATVIDGIILGVVGGIVRAAAGTGAQYGVSFVAGLLYASLLIANRTQTVGMSAVGTRCVDANTGAPISLGRAFGRTLVSQLLSITIIGGILDILWPLWDARNQTLHDKAVNTLVVMSRSTVIAAPPYPQAGPGTGAWGSPPPQTSGWGAGAPSQPGGWSDSPAPSSGGWTDSPAPAPPAQGGGWSEAPAPEGGGWAAAPQTGWSPEGSSGWQSTPQPGVTPPPGPATPPPPAPGAWQPAPPAPAGWQPAQTPAPPAAPEQSVPAAWYPDPAGSGQERWWDGRSWTDHLRASS